jgi:hypothetical protein
MKQQDLDRATVRYAIFEVRLDGQTYNAVWFQGKFTKCEVQAAHPHPVTGAEVKHDVTVSYSDFECGPTDDNALAYTIASIAESKALFEETARRA